MSNFTQHNIKCFKAYERVRRGGKYNMFDPRARAASRLDKDDYLFVMNHYAELRDAAAAQTGETK